MSEHFSSFPAVFVSHGAPDLPLRSTPTTDFFQQLGARLGKPRAILAVSAHWTTPQPRISTAVQPKTIHDFSGFPAALYQLKYAAPGAPKLATRALQLLNEKGISAEANSHYGFDHGAWVPLMMMYPNADIPVTQLSIQAHANPAHHWAIGRALEPLRQEGVLILASGSATHNLWEIRGDDYAAKPPDWVTSFAQWLNDAVTHSKTEDLLNYRKLAPFAQQNHPTDEHLLPLFVALGAGGTEAISHLLHDDYTLGVLSMAAYAFGQPV